MHEMIVRFQRAYQNAGTDVSLGENLSIGYHFYIADSKQKALADAAPFYEENLKMFGPLRLVKALSDDQIEAMGNPKTAPYAGLPTIEDAEGSGGFLAGPSELIVEKLKALEEKYPGLERVNVSLPMGTPQDVLIEQMQMFSEQVIPQFKNITVTTN